MDTNLRTTSEIFSQYLNEVSNKYSQTQTSEYGYRTQFENLLKEVFKEIKVNQIDHDAKAVGGNKPDFVLSKLGIPILFIEVKDIGVSLDKIENSEQLARYYGYDNLVLTDYLEFRFYRNGIRYVEPITIAKFDKKERIIIPIPENYELLKKTLIDFPQSHKEPIKSGSHLAKIMGGKAYRIRENAKEMLSGDDKEKRSIYKVYETMRRQLIHDMTPDGFADMYAQTLVYGLFVARFHDESPNTFTRAEARDLVPASNPLLRHFFDHITGTDFDKRLEHIVDELCIVFTHSDIEKLMSNYYGTEKDSKDPVIHFYEDFLQEYDKQKRKEFGAYYTPLPVVQFIVRSVDHILEHDFKLAGGLSNNSKNEKGHIVQVLDPATGTGTFLTEVIKNIYKKRANQLGNWGSYVYKELLPRLFGFEIMIAPYTIAHLKMSMLLKEMKFKYFNSGRLGIYLTNSLQEGNTIEQMFSSFGLAESISEESKQASKIKKEKPIMVVMGNPPYSGESSNKGDNFKWITHLLEDYKKEPEGLERLNERNPKWINDDYVKFLRFGQHFVEQNKTGIVAFINPHGFLDNPTFRGMRWRLLKAYDKIYVLNLHGNSKKKEVSPDGSKDENVFDIQQGVSINIFVKTGEKKENELGKVFYEDLYGARKKKFEYLNNNSLETVRFKNVEYKTPMYFMIPKNTKSESEYEKGFKISELFGLNSLGLLTKRDSLSTDMSKDNLVRKIEHFIDPNYSVDLLCKEFDIPLKDNDKWNAKITRDNNKNVDLDKIKKQLYRPFDLRYVYYSKDFVARTNEKVLSHFSNSNFGLIIGRQGHAVGSMEWNLCFVSSSITDQNIFYRGGGTVFPLYLYGNEGKSINFDLKIFENIQNSINKVTELELFDYIYAILHSTSYRIKYAEFLKTDFPRIPYPKDRKTFDKLAKLGKELRIYHLMENEAINPFEISYLGEGENIVTKPEFKERKIYINDTQYFENVSDIAWNFYIGGYQPAQKWLKDRKGQELSNDDIEHYQKVLIVLRETDRLMKEIDKIDFLTPNAK